MEPFLGSFCILKTWHCGSSAKGPFLIKNIRTQSVLFFQILSFIIIPVVPAGSGR